MKLRLLISGLLSFTFCVGVNAADVPDSIAEQVAVKVYTERYFSAFGELPGDVSIPEMYGEASSEGAILYIFNFANDGGFAIISGQDNVLPVLAYSFKGKYDPALVQPAFTDWIENYSDQIVYAIHHNLPSTPLIDREWAKYLKNSSAERNGPQSVLSVGPLLNTTWNQGCYYNEQTPAGSAACSHQWTGCGATAQAQMIRYHNYPVNGIGNHSYTWSSITHNVDFSTTTYNYAGMPNSISSSTPDVAQLMYHCGVSLDMQYGNSASNCFFNFNSSLPTYFGYQNIITNWFKLFITNDTIYENRIVAELDSLRPTFYKGQGSSGQHFFICDGYQNSSFPFSFHFNWGWGGLYDGYFYCSALNPGSYSFTLGQGAAIRVMPPSPLAVEENAVQADFSFYPNPAANEITILKNSAEKARIGLFDLSGRMVLEKEVSATNSKVSVEGIAPGVYLLQLTEGNSIVSKKIIVQ